MSLRALLAVFCCALLVSCAAPPQRQPAPACRSTWSGRLSAVPAAADRAPLLAGYRLELGADGSGRLALSDPLGQTLVEADWGEGGAHLSGHGLGRDYASFEAMLSDAIGVALPRQALPAWLAGRPLAAALSTPIPGGGFEQLGWRVTPDGVGGAVHRLHLERPAGGSLTLVVDSHADCGAGAAARAP